MAKKGRALEEKLSMVLEGLRGGASISELCRRNGISQSQYYKWRDKFLEGGRDKLNGGAENGETRLKSKINELERALGRATMTIEILKKNEEMMGR